MKNVSTYLLALSLGVSLAACGTDSGTNDEGTGTDAQDDGSGSAGDDAAGSDSANADTGADAADAADDSGGADAADDGNGELACVHTCSADEDCLVGGMDFDFVCDSGSCVNGNPCTSDDVCVAQLSGWAFVPCTMGGGECAATMQICVDLGDGTGGCATAPSEFVMCESFNFAEVTVTNLDDGSDVTVCGNTNAQCDTETGACTSPCQDDTTCPTGWVCDTGSGVCGCDDDADCGEGGTCNADGTCSVPACTSDEDCTNPFDGGSIACE